jgi:hypothetical protein
MSVRSMATGLQMNPGIWYGSEGQTDSSGRGGYKIEGGLQEMPSW